MTPRPRPTTADLFRQLPIVCRQTIGRKLLNRDLDEHAPYGDLLRNDRTLSDAIVALASASDTTHRAAMCLLLGRDVPRLPDDPQLRPLPLPPRIRLVSNGSQADDVVPYSVGELTWRAV